MDERDPLVTKLYNKILEGHSVLATPALSDEDSLSVRQKIKMIYEEIILCHTQFAADSRILSDYWDKLFYPTFKAKDQFVPFSLYEARGCLMSLYSVLWSKFKDEPNQSLVTIIYDLLMYQGDLERYGGDKEAASGNYMRAVQLLPTFGRAYNQLAVLLAPKNHSMALRYFLLSLVVQSPFGGARENLRKALGLFTGKNTPITVTKVLSFVLIERFTGRKQHYQREKAVLKESKGFDFEEGCLLWLTLILEPGLLDTQDISFTVEQFLSFIALSLQSEHPSVFPAIHYMLQGYFIAKTKRFESAWEPIVTVITKYCNVNVGECSDPYETLLLPEDSDFKGISFFSCLKPGDETHAEVSQVRSARLFSLANALQKHGLVYNHPETGKWYNKADFEREEKRQRTGTLLARQRLKDEVERLESQVTSRIILEKSPWLIPDFDYLLTNWSYEILPSIERHHSRYLITFAVLAELDYAKNGQQVGPTARSIISKLAELANAHDPSIRLQKLTETMSVDSGKKALGPKEAHRRKFLEAVAYYGTRNGDQFRILSENPDLIQTCRQYITLS